MYRSNQDILFFRIISSMKMHRMLFVIIACLVAHFGHSQNQSLIDSLHQELVHAESDEERVEVYYALSYEWAEFSFDSANFHAQEGYLISRKIDNPKLISLGYSSIGSAYFCQYELDSAIGYYDKAREVSQQFQDTSGLVKATFNIGNIYLMTGKLEDALDVYEEAQVIYRSMGDQMGIARAWNNKALVFRRTKQNEMAKKALLEAIDIYKSIDEPKKTYNALSNLASIYLLLEEYDSAILVAKSNIDLARSLQNQSYELQPLVVIGQSFEKLEELDSSFSYYNKARELINEYTPTTDKVYVYFGLATYYLNKDEHRPAKPYLDSLEELGPFDKILNLAIPYYEMTAKFHRLNGDLELAYAQRLKYEEMKDTYHDQQLLDRTTELELVFEKEKRELEIAKLQLENEKKSQQTIALIIISSLAFLALIFLVILFYQRQAKNKLKHQLLNEEIESLRLRISRIYSEVKLSEIETDIKKIQSAFHNDLSEREAEILQLAVTNKTNAEIAESVHLSVNTVKYHLKNIYSKIGVSSRLEARQVMSEA